MRRDTAATVINDALLELGLVAEEVADPYTSDDRNVILMRAFLKALGRDLVAMRAWSHLQVTHTLSTADGVESYDLPADYVSMLPGTEWNRTTALRLGGPVQAPEWQVLKSSAAVNPVNYLFRVVGNRLYLHPTPTAVETLAFEYLSSSWAGEADETAPSLAAPTSATQVLWFDGPLLSRGLKVKFLEARGFDSSAARNEYEAALARAMGNDGANAPLSLNAPSRAPGPRLPETNWGV